MTQLTSVPASPIEPTLTPEAVQFSTYRLARYILDYATGRASDVARGAETPHLAALLLQKYGLGIVAAADVTLGIQANITLRKILDKEVAQIDPQWQEHAKERWAHAPADVTG